MLIKANEIRKRQLKDLVHELKCFRGLTRKSVLGDVLSILNETAYDDAGFLDVGNFKVVVSCDGIVENIVRNNPWLSGYYSVLVNVNDVAAKGANPLGFVNIISSSSSDIRRKIAEGIQYGLRKYRLTLLKGHTHPDASYDAVDGAVVGVAKKILPSTAAEAGDLLIIAIDLDGKFYSNGWLKTFDSTTSKSSEEVIRQLDSMVELAEKGLAHAAKDISGPGIVGTIAMLCESSRVGASINIENIPKPENINVQDWLITYPSTGFIVTTNRPQECVELFRKHGLTASVAGTILETRTVRISYRGQVETLMNLERESVFGFEDKNTTTNGADEKIEVKELSEMEIPEIEALLKKVWSTAYEYPEEWRKRRMLTKEQISREMQEGYRFFGIKIGDKLVGMYKALKTGNSLFGEHQSVDPDYRRKGLATAMYHHFIRFARKNNCKKVYVNILTNQTASKKIVEKMGFRKKGQEYEQAKGMKVQMYEKDV